MWAWGHREGGGVREWRHHYKRENGEDMTRKLGASWSNLHPQRAKVIAGMIKCHTPFTSLLEWPTLPSVLCHSLHLHIPFYPIHLAALLTHLSLGSEATHQGTFPWFSWLHSCRTLTFWKQKPPHFLKKDFAKEKWPWFQSLTSFTFLYIIFTAYDRRLCSLQKFWRI